MKKLIALFSVLILTGQGCFGGGGIDSRSDGGMWVTVNAGEEWVQVNAVPNAKGVGTLAGTNVVSLTTDPQDKETIYAGLREDGLFYSTDRGRSWQQPREEALRSGLVSDVVVHPTEECTVYVARGPRLMKTDNCLRTFDVETYVETRSGVAVRRVTIDWFNPEVVWMGLSNGDVLKSENGGETWRNVLNARRAITDLLMHQGDSRVLLASTDRDGFYKTTDGGATWVHIEDELRAFRNGARVIGMTQDNASTAVLASTEFGLLRSEDFGSTWSGVDLLSSPGQVTIRAFAVAPNDADAIRYAAGSTFYVSDDGGVTWTTNNIPSTRRPEAMLVDPDDDSVVYIGVASLEK